MNNLLEYKGYYGSAEFSTDDEVFYGKLLGLSDLVTFEGNSISELEKAFRESVDDYLATCREMKKTPEISLL